MVLQVYLEQEQFNLTSSDNKIRFNYNTGSFPAFGSYEGMFVYDYSGNDNPYVADSGGWVKILNRK